MSQNRTAYGVVAPALLPTSIALVRSVDAATASGVYLTIYYQHHHFRMRLSSSCACLPLDTKNYLTLN